MSQTNKQEKNSITTVLDFMKHLNTKNTNLDYTYQCNNCMHTITYKELLEQFKQNCLFECTNCNKMCVIPEMYSICIDYSKYWMKNCYQNIIIDISNWLKSVTEAKNLRYLKIIKYNKEIDHLYSKHKSYNKYY